MTDPVTEELIEAEKKARNDKVLVALAQERLSALASDGERIMTYDDFPLSHRGYRQINQLRGSIETLRCFVDPSRVKCALVGYLTAEAVGEAIDDVDYFIGTRG